MNIKEKIEKILALAMEISPPDVKRNYEKEPTVFVSYSGRYSCLNVDIYNGDGAETTIFNVFGLYDKKHAKDVHQQLDMVIRYLEKLRR